MGTRSMLLEQPEVAAEVMAGEAALEVSILLPCLNEAETLEACVREAEAALVAAAATGEVLVADNGSGDGSPALARAAGARVVEVTARGYGNALAGGIAAARGRYVLMGDADGSYDFGELPRFLEALRGGADLVRGCRLPAGGGQILAGAMPWKHRWIGNPLLTFLGRLFFTAPIHDFHCGLRAFRREALLGLGLQCPGMEFASEMVVRATFARLTVTEVPVTLRPDGRSRPPHLRSWRDGWRHLRFMLLFSPRWLFLVPGLALLLTGCTLTTLLYFTPLRVAGAGLDIHSMLYAAAGALLGLQFCLFALFARVAAHAAGLLPRHAFLERVLRLFTL